MTPTPPSASSSRGDNSPDFRVVRKRNRIPLSCAPCRNRKLKCNRQAPCDNCVKRGDSGSCTYAAPPTRKKGSSSVTSNGTPDDMQNRIDRLEGLVLSLMTNGSQAPGPAAAAQVLSANASTIGSGSLGPNLDSTLDESYMMDAESQMGEDESETDGVTKSMGILKVDAEQQKTIYIGEAHWAAVLNEISEVKSYFTQHKREFEAQMEKVAQARKAQGGSDIGSGPALLFGASVPPSRSEILRELPSKYICDILVGRYFNTYDPSTHILHGPAFQRQYEIHWSDPSKTSIVWIGMLFAMLRLAMISYNREGDEPPEFRGKCQDMASTYRTQMAHCMITADYTKPHNFLMETLIFHMHAEYSSNKDTEASVWVLSGIIARLAMRMGYHRDSKIFPNLTPFQGEMRRRIWTFVRSADLLFSFQLALPSMIRIGDSDTDLPRNIYDEEFDEDSKELPPSRPATEATPISYMIAKGRLAFGFGRVLEEVHGINKHGYDEILKIDKGLQDIYHSIPEHLKLRPMSEQQLAPVALIMSRFSLATIYYKSLCVLHGRFVRLAKGNNKYTYSRRTCIDSAMQLLNFQAIQYHQTQDRGRLRSLRDHVNSLTTHDYLLGASAICIDLYGHRERADNDVATPSTSVSGSISQRSNSVSRTSEGAYIAGLAFSREDMIQALEKSREIWYANRDFSIEAYKASELLAILIRQVRLPLPPSQGNAPTTAAPTPSFSDNSSNNNDEQTAAMTLGMLQAGGMADRSAQAIAAAKLAQQAEQAAGTWDGNPYGKSGGNPLLNAFLNGGQNIQGYGGAMADSPGVFGASNTAMFPDAIFGNVGAGNGLDVNMNFDWDTWENYMQPANLSLDPAVNLWSSNSPNSSNNNIFAQQTPGSEASSNNNANMTIGGNNNGMSGPDPSGNNGSDVKYNGMSSNYFSQQPRIGMQDISTEVPPQGNNSSMSTNMNSNMGVGVGGDAFMGAETPGPGTLGRGAWTWKSGINGETGRN